VLDSRLLSNGDVIRIGATELRFEEMEPPM
jgi:hypothetical protein